MKSKESGNNQSDLTTNFVLNQPLDSHLKVIFCEQDKIHELEKEFRNDMKRESQEINEIIRRGSSKDEKVLSYTQWYKMNN